MKKQKQKKTTNTIWFKIRPLMIALLVIAVAIGSVQLFQRGNANGNTSQPAPVLDAKSTVINLTDSEFSQTISEGVVLVDFWAVWCPPCRIQGPIIEDLARDIGHMATIAKLDVDHNPRSARAHRVQNIPTLIIFKDGQQVERFVGVQQKETLKAAIKSHI